MTTQAQEPSYEFSVGDRFRKAREMGTALDQKKFAELIGVSRDTIRKVEHATVIEEVRKPIRAAYSMSTGYAREWLETGTMPEQPTGAPLQAVPEEENLQQTAKKRPRRELNSRPTAYNSHRCAA